MRRLHSFGSAAFANNQGVLRGATKMDRVGSGASWESDPFPLREIQPPVILNLPWQVKNPRLPLGWTVFGDPSTAEAVLTEWQGMSGMSRSG
jgi:hypothetical protein